MPETGSSTTTRPTAEEAAQAICDGYVDRAFVKRVTRSVEVGNKAAHGHLLRRTGTAVERLQRLMQRTFVERADAVCHGAALRQRGGPV